MGRNRTVNLEGCVDCLMMAANGLEGCDMTPEELERVERGFASWHEEGFIIVPGHDDGGFSWSTCQVCGSRLGGDRFELTAVSR